MRIVAGAARGRRLVAPAGRAVRPTPDRVREALFASLAPILPGARVVDGYAGSGALGLEARSRGAAHVVLVEQDRRALDAVRANVARVGLGEVEVVAAPFERWLVSGAHAAGPFDLALLDPPYALAEDALAAVLGGLTPHLAPGATVVVERASDGPAPRWPVTLLPESPRRYGSTTLHRARVADDPAAPSTEPA